MQKAKLYKLQAELDERRRLADESSLRRAALSSQGGSSSNAYPRRYSKSRSRLPDLPEQKRRDATRNLDNSFMAFDALGNIVPKTPETGLVAATT
jgi:hypothetical protein